MQSVSVYILVMRLTISCLPTIHYNHFLVNYLFMSINPYPVRLSPTRSLLSLLARSAISVLSDP